jgi:hypothetical protein
MPSRAASISFLSSTSVTYWSLDRVEHVAEQLQELVGLGLGRDVRLGDRAEIGHGPRPEDEGRNTDEQKLAH